MFSLFYKKKNFYKFLENKKIALVGPANYLTKYEYGDHIDSFDLVIRINRGLELIERYKENIGSKTDIVYNCLIETNENGGLIDIEYYKKKGVKWICSLPYSNYQGVSKNDELHPLVKKKTIKDIKKNFHFHLMDFKLSNKINQKVNCRANTGFAAIFDILNSNIKELYITGFSFYLDSFIDGYKKGAKWNEKDFALRCFNSERHKQGPQWKMLKEQFLKDKKIKVDPVLKKILEMDNLSRGNFIN